jgi:ElaB/YqjD/DUF883 family membrane-anchored ribosome-binding protein
LSPLKKEITMDRTTPTGSSLTGSSGTPNVNAKVEGAARSAHETTDKIANKATAEVDRISGSAHRAVNSVADTASSAASWASDISDHAQQMQTQLVESATGAIRAQPIATVAGALLIGYLLGRL